MQIETRKTPTHTRSNLGRGVGRRGPGTSTCVFSPASTCGSFNFRTCQRSSRNSNARGGGEQKLKGVADRGAGSSGELLLGSVEFYRPAEESLQRVRFKAPWKAGQRKAVKADKESGKRGERKGETEGK